MIRFHVESRSRFIMLATVLSVCLLCLGCSNSSPVLEGDSEAIIALKEAGAEVRREPTPGLPDLTGHVIDMTEIKMDAEILGHLAQVESMVELKLTGQDVTDETLSALTACKHLHTLDLSGSAVTDAGLKHLKPLNTLASLSLGDTKVTGSGLQDVPQVGVLQLTNLPVDDGDLQNLKHLKKLTFLTLSGTQVTPSGLAEFKKSRPSLLVMGIKQN